MGRGLLHEDEGQSTLEYLAVLLGVIAVVVGLGALLGLFAGGALSRRAADGASHAVGSKSDPAGALLDVLLY